MDVVRKLVSGRLTVQAAGPHPDPELLAAFAENSLSNPSRTELLEHLSACSDCRHILYLALPEQEAQQVLAFHRRQPRFAVRWATLAAMVIILGSVLVNRELLTGHREVSAPAPVATPSPGPEIAKQNAPVQTDVAKSMSAGTPESRASGHAEAKHMTAKPQANLRFDQSGEVHFAAPAALNSGDESKLADNRMALAKPAVQWGLSPAGAVERSLDSGNSWQAVLVADGAAFTAITSVGTHIWVGGPAGTLYHSADSGQNWSRIQPASAGKKLDSTITGIQFSGQMNGTVSAANGQVWSTSDGGQSWRLQ